MHLVSSSTKLTDCGSVFQNLSFLKASLAFVTNLFGFNPIPVNFLEVR